MSAAAAVRRLGSRRRESRDRPRRTDERRRGCVHADAEHAQKRERVTPGHIATQSRTPPSRAERTGSRRRSQPRTERDRGRTAEPARPCRKAAARRDNQTGPPSERRSATQTDAAKRDVGRQQTPSANNERAGAENGSHYVRDTAANAPHRKNPDTRAPRPATIDRPPERQHESAGGQGGLSRR